MCARLYTGVARCNARINRTFNNKNQEDRDRAAGNSVNMSDNPKIKVILVDDHAILRSGIKQILLASGDIDVVGEAENAAQAIKCARDLKADVMLLVFRCQTKPVLKHSSRSSARIRIYRS